MICKQCNLEQEDTEFRKHYKICRQCVNKNAREYRKKPKEKPEFIICNKCNKQTSDFRVDRKRCNDCERERGRNYRRNTDKAKIWAENNKERLHELQHNWYEKEKVNIREKLKERMKTDEKCKFSMEHRRAVNSLLRLRTNKTKYLNCNSKELREWIEYQFRDGMTFDNYNKTWVLDHVLPIDLYINKDHDIKLIFNYLNIAPVPKTANLVKNKHINIDQCTEHINKIRSYIEIHELKTSFLESFENAVKILCETP